MTWINIKEKLPDPDTYVLVYEEHEGVIYEGLNIHDDFFQCENYRKVRARFWMPAPDPPITEQ